jgi:hypothetical protein
MGTWIVGLVALPLLLLEAVAVVVAGVPVRVHLEVALALLPGLLVVLGLLLAGQAVPLRKRRGWGTSKNRAQGHTNKRRRPDSGSG